MKQKTIMQKTKMIKFSYHIGKINDLEEQLDY